MNRWSPANRSLLRTSRISLSFTQCRSSTHRYKAGRSCSSFQHSTHQGTLKYITTSSGSSPLDTMSRISTDRQQCKVSDCTPSRKSCSIRSRNNSGAPGMRSRMSCHPDSSLRHILNNCWKEFHCSACILEHIVHR